MTLLFTQSGKKVHNYYSAVQMWHTDSNK